MPLIDNLKQNKTQVNAYQKVMNFVHKTRNGSLKDHMFILLKIVVRLLAVLKISM